MADVIVRHEQPAAADGDGGGRLAVDVDGGLVRLRARYDPDLVAQIKTLPDRRFIRARREWVLPARRHALALLALLVERLGDAAQPTERARRRLDRARPGTIHSRDGEFDLSLRYDPRRLTHVRSIPERTYRPDRRTWTVPPTRAGAIALLELLERAEFTAAPDVVARLARLAAAREPTDTTEDRTPGDQRRTSPAPHWRHVTRGAIFHANPDRHEWIDGIGWCVRVRVNPTRRR